MRPVVSDTSGPLLSVEELSVAFKTDAGLVRALDGVELAVGRAELAGLVGETGSGKSVTANSIMGLLPRPPAVVEAGRIIFNGQDLLTAEARNLRRLRGRRLAMIFQDPFSSLNPVQRIGRQLVEAIRLHRRLSRAEARELAEQSLAAAGVPEARLRLDEYPHQLSGGMRQRVMIAMALAGRPDLLLADEPTTALDVTVEAQVLGLILEMNQRLGTAVLLISHDLQLVADVCDRIWVMYAGRLVELAPARLLLHEPLHPYSQGLVDCAPRIGRRRQVLPTISGQVPDLRRPPGGCRFHPRCPKAVDLCRQEKPLFRQLAAQRWVACHRAEAG
ncbi:MAG: ABC transporter ATP-binding protein [Deltaproteobacteria bacterium]|nr:ABC transporter ATP-binding protein [Deltaproteobacteria bacterium]